MVSIISTPPTATVSNSESVVEGSEELAGQSLLVYQNTDGWLRTGATAGFSRAAAETGYYIDFIIHALNQGGGKTVLKYNLLDEAQKAKRKD